MLIAVVLVLVGVRAVLLLPLRVHGDSMRPTIRAGDIVLVARFGRHWQAVGRGDVVVLNDAAGGRSVKRVVATGGQQVKIEDAVLLVDGQAVNEPWVDRDSVDGLYFGPVVVPAGSVFVLGDDRARSVDSRHDGPVPLDRLLGRVVVRIWSSR